MWSRASALPPPNLPLVKEEEQQSILPTSGKKHCALVAAHRGEYVSPFADKLKGNDHGSYIRIECRTA